MPDGGLLGRLTRIFVETVQTSYARRAAQQGALGAKTGTVGAVQRTSSDLRLNPKLHVVVLDGFTLHAATRAGGLQSQDEEESGGEREVNGSRGRAGPELSIWGFTDGVGFAATQGGSA